MKAIVFDNYIEKFNKINKFLNIEKIKFEIIRFKNGESKIIVDSSVENEDVIVFSDFSNSLSYSYGTRKRYYSKDEYYVELKRLISALDNAKSVSVFLPLIYECRQNSNNLYESKDFLMFINDLKQMGVENIITFEAHGEDKYVKSFSLSNLFKDKAYDVVVSPDKGGYSRASEYSNLLNCDLVCFSKKRDLEHVVDGSNPILEYSHNEYDFNGKKVLIVDDILDSGSTIVNAINNIDNASSVDVFIAYPLFNKGVKVFKKLVKEGKLNKIYISDLIHVSDKLTNKNFIEIVDTSECISEVILEVVK